MSLEVQFNGQNILLWRSKPVDGEEPKEFTVDMIRGQCDIDAHIHSLGPVYRSYSGEVGLVSLGGKPIGSITPCAVPGKEMIYLFHFGNFLHSVKFFTFASKTPEGEEVPANYVVTDRCSLEFPF